MVYVQRHQSVSDPAVKRITPPTKWPANNDTFSSFLHPSALAVEEFLHALTGLEHSEMMDLVPSNIAYNRSVRCPI